jgi:hypothetical protein
MIAKIALNDVCIVRIEDDGGLAITDLRYPRPPLTANETLTLLGFLEGHREAIEQKAGIEKQDIGDVPV